jgi:Flp pilus assembly protein TadD
MPMLPSEAVGAQSAYLQGVLALTALDYSAAVRHFERATQLAPTNPVYARILSFARQKL